MKKIKPVPLLMRYINVSIVYLFYKVFIALEIKVALISSSLSKAVSGCRDQWADCTDKPPFNPLLAVPWADWGVGKD